MSQLIYVLNGPNLNMLGRREPHLYGHDTLDMIKGACLARAKAHGLEIDFRQSNYEGALVEAVHEARDKAAAIVINPAGLSFHSIPLLDALKMFERPKIEVHLTNIHQRDALYQKSIISLTATAVICGLGALGYPIAVDAVAALLARAAR
jgi:3-dehydroquinate dehydratase-2